MASPIEPTSAVLPKWDRLFTTIDDNISSVESIDFWTFIDTENNFDLWQSLAMSPALLKSSTTAESESPPR